MTAKKVFSIKEQVVEDLATGLTFEVTLPAIRNIYAAPRNIHIYAPISPLCGLCAMMKENVRGSDNRR